MATIQIYGELPHELTPEQEQYIADAYDACEEKGATMPEEKTLENLADCIASIS